MVRFVTSQALLAENVRNARLAQGLTWELLAFRAGVSVRTVSRIERAVHVPHRSTLRLIAQALGTTPEELLSDAGTAA